MKQTRFYMTETTLVQNHGGLTAWVVREPNGGIDSAYIIEDLARDRVATLNSTIPKGKPMSSPISRFLADGGYESIAAWAHDSDYVLETDGDWHQVDNPGFPVSIIDCIHDAIDACGWVDPGEPDETSTLAIHLKFHTPSEPPLSRVAALSADLRECLDNEGDYALIMFDLLDAIDLLLAG